MEPMSKPAAITDTLTAFLVQNVSRHMPDNIAWVIWVAPGVIGGFLIARWIGNYRRKFSVPTRGLG